MLFMIDSVLLVVNFDGLINGALITLQVLIRKHEPPSIWKTNIRFSFYAFCNF